MPYSATSALVRSSSWAYASGCVRSSSCCQRHSRGAPEAGPSTHSGCARTRSLSSLTISGSNHSPNSRPRPLTWSTRGARPSGQTSPDTTQSPRPARSWRREATQPELDVEPLLDQGETEFGQARGRARREVLVDEVGERIAPPEEVGLAEE